MSILTSIGQGDKYLIDKLVEEYDLSVDKISLNKDGTIDYIGSLSLDCSGREEIPVQFNVVQGSFTIRHGEMLRSLKGSPYKIEKSFYCYDCHVLETLEGGPVEVGGCCEFNNCFLIRTMEGCPKTMGSHITLNQCINLRSLKGLPERTNNNNQEYKILNLLTLPLLKNLEYCPHNINDVRIHNVGNYVGNSKGNRSINLKGIPEELKYFSIYGCFINGFNNGPKKIDTLYLDKCTVKSLKDFPMKIGKIIMEECGGLKTLEGLPTKITDSLDIRNLMDLRSLKGAPQEVGTMCCVYCSNLKTLEGCPKEIHGGINISGCDKLISLKGCPEKIYGNFSCNNCSGLKTLEGGPKEIGVGCSYTCVYCDGLKTLKGMPNKVSVLECSYCMRLESWEGLADRITDGVKCVGVGVWGKNKNMIKELKERGVKILN